MSRDRAPGSDGLLTGILVALVVIVIGGFGLGLVGYRFTQVGRDRAIMAELQAREAAEQAALQAELARQAAESARVASERAKSPASEPQLKNNPLEITAPPDGPSGPRRQPE